MQATGLSRKGGLERPRKGDLRGRLAGDIPGGFCHGIVQRWGGPGGLCAARGPREGAIPLLKGRLCGRMKGERVG